MRGPLELDAFGIGVAVRDVALELEAFPGIDSKVGARALRELTGGPVPNALVTLARLGRRAAFAGVVGEDDAGARVRADLESEGVDASALQALPSFETPTSVILVAGATRTVVECGQGDLPEHALDAEACVERAGRAAWLLADGRLPTSQKAAAERVRSGRGRVMLDGGTPRPGLEALIPLADVALFSSSYALRSGIALGDSALLLQFLEDLASRLPTDGLGIAGLTLGPRGSLVVDRAGRVYRHAAPEVDAVDTTGAGDVFHGALVDALLADAPFEDAARFAHAAAAASCRAATARAPLPSRPVLEKAARDGTLPPLPRASGV